MKREDFNPRPREEGDVDLSAPPQPDRVYFNPRPREEGDVNKLVSLIDELDFNPRPREEGDAPLWLFSGWDSISIHALVKRATANLYNDYLYFEAKYHISDIFPL